MLGMFSTTSVFEIVCWRGQHHAVFLHVRLSRSCCAIFAMRSTFYLARGLIELMLTPYFFGVTIVSRTNGKFGAVAALRFGLVKLYVGARYLSSTFVCHWWAGF